MEDVELALLFKYPTILKISEVNAVVYKGSIYVNNEDYDIYLKELPDNNFQLTLSEKLKHLEAEFDTIMTKLSPKSIITILDSLSSFIKVKIPTTTPTDHCDVYRHVLYEYSDFTNFFLNLKSCHLAHDLTEVKASTVDQGGREHAVTISISFEDKDTFNISSYDLPLDKEVFKKSSSLKEVYNQFLGTVEAYQPFFDEMDILDGNSWVLDPPQPERSCRYRRIWIQENFSVMITLDPADVTRLPEIKFLGPERMVEKYREILNANIAEWDPGNGLFSEILKMLGLECFPPKPTAEESGPDLLMESGDCSICFSSRLNDKLPDVVCKNKPCENSYHAECLYEWLVSVNARRFFSEVVGLCPNCEKNISCPIPK